MLNCFNAQLTFVKLYQVVTHFIKAYIILGYTRRTRSIFSILDNIIHCLNTVERENSMSFKCLSIVNVFLFIVTILKRPNDIDS